MKPKVSIVIACYNDPNIVTAVRSAYEQSLVEKEIIVVNDGSNEATVRAIRSVSQFIDVLIDQKNQGQSIARNNGIRKSEGEFILSLDSDDFFENSFCEKAVRKFKEDEKIKIVTCSANRFDVNGIIDVFTPKGGTLNDFLFSNSALGSSMFKKEDWEKFGGYEEKIPILGMEDWEFYIRLLSSGGYAYVINEVLFNYQLRPDSTTQKIKYERNQKFQQIVLKHQELYQGNFDDLVINLFERIRKEEKEKIKAQHSIESKIGALIIKPLRIVKSKFFNR